MRILLDLQSCQTEGSKNRGIGRYSISLAEAMIRQGKDHEFFVILNGAFPEAARAVRDRLSAILPQERIRTFEIVTPCSPMSQDNLWRHQASIALREAFIADLKPDALHTTSLFEGLGDDAVTEIPPPRDGVIQAVTVYDLIPYIKSTPYLDSPDVKRWYYRRLQSLKRADLLLTISSSSRAESIEYLHIPGDRAVNISSAIDPVFKPIKLGKRRHDALLAKYGLGDRFVMYTGGIDHRKNIEGLIEAYAKLPATTRKNRQLAIVCSVRDHDRTRLLDLARSFGLKDGELVLSGYVPEDDLVALYNICELFVFPSLHEGFGLPVLEAMACGAPTIGADNSSIPEVIDLPEALFDASDIAAITAKIEKVLDDPAFSERLRKHGLRQSKAFSWDASAQVALAAIEARHARARRDRTVAPTCHDAPPRLALVSPLPPARTGIATYSDALLPELCRHYDVDVVTDQDAVESAWALANCDIVSVEEFERRANINLYDRILYHIGNSEFHSHVPELMVRHPGVLVLHDFFLSGLQNWRQTHSAGKDHFIDALVETHGYGALEHLASQGGTAAIARYSANAPVVQSAAGVIVHSASSAAQLERHFGLTPGDEVRQIPHIGYRATVTREQARRALRLDRDAFLICSFGILAPEKKNDLVVRAFELAELVKEKHVHLVFVGSAPGEFGKALGEQISSLGARANVSITGYVDDATYNDYLAAADLAVQLRGGSRGETSGAVLEVMNYGVPLIVNAHGTMAEIDPEAVVMLPDQIEVQDLADALRGLYKNSTRRQALADAARRIIVEDHAPAVVGRLYHEAIEHFAAEHPASRHQKLIQRVARDPLTAGTGVEDLSLFAAASAHNLVRPGPKRLFVDISLSLNERGDADRRAWVLSVLDGLIAIETDYRVEPVYMAEDEQGLFRSARSFMARHVGWKGPLLQDRVVTPVQGDVFLGLDSSAHSAGAALRSGLFTQWRAHAVTSKFIVHASDLSPLHAQDAEFDEWRTERIVWVDGIAAAADEIIATSGEVAADFETALGIFGTSRSAPLRISHPSEGSDGNAVAIKVALKSEAEHHSVWTPPEILRFDGRHPSVGSQIGDRRGSVIASTGREGFLIFGPYVPMPRGSYICRIWGRVSPTRAGDAFADITTDTSHSILNRMRLGDIDFDKLAPGMIASIPFDIERDCTDLEVRVWVDATAEIVFDRLDLEKVVVSTDGSDEASSIPELQTA